MFCKAIFRENDGYYRKLRSFFKSFTLKSADLLHIVKVYCLAFIYLLHKRNIPVSVTLQGMCKTKYLVLNTRSTIWPTHLKCKVCYNIQCNKTPICLYIHKIWIYILFGIQSRTRLNIIFCKFSYVEYLSVSFFFLTDIVQFSNYHGLLMRGFPYTYEIEMLCVDCLFSVISMYVVEEQSGLTMSLFNINRFFCEMWSFVCKVFCLNWKKKTNWDYLARP